MQWQLKKKGSEGKGGIYDRKGRKYTVKVRLFVKKVRPEGND